MSFDFSNPRPSDDWASEPASAPSGQSPALPQPDLGPGPGTPAGGSLTAAPWPILVVGFVLVALSLALHLAGGGLLLASMGWLLAGPAAIAAFAVFTTIDGRRRATPLYRTSGLADGLRRLLVVAAVVAVAINAWSIADHIARSGRFG